MAKSKVYKSLFIYSAVLLSLTTLWYMFVDTYLKTIRDNIILLELIYIPGKILFMIVPAVLYLKITGCNDILGYLKMKYNKIKALKSGLLISLFFIAYIILLGFLFLKVNINFNIGIYYLIAGIMVGFLEEIPFRGVIMQKLNEVNKFWTANFISSLIFVVFHFPVWIMRGHSNIILINSIFVLLISLIFGYIFKKKNSLLVPIIIHSIYDISFWIIIGTS